MAPFCVLYYEKKILAKKKTYFSERRGMVAMWDFLWKQSIASTDEKTAPQKIFKPIRNIMQQKAKSYTL